MQYVSTRGDKNARAFTDISFTAFAPDGGLWMPDEVPQVTPEKLHTWLGTDYAGLAFEIFHLFAPEIPRRDLWTLCRDAYQPKEFSFRRNPFDAEAVTPVTWLRDGVALLELSNGPTLAVDDLSLRFASLYLQRVLPEDKRPRILLGATSGDMGASAAHHFANIPGVDLVLVSPKDRMSQCQARILYNETAPNIHHLVGEGTFDDCQDLVNRVLADEEFCRENRIGAINSTLWMRIVSHLVYYFWSYLQAVDRVGEEVVYAVPAGNFGNAYAGWLAKRMGLPIMRLIVATNENDTFDRFVRTGVYRPRPSSETIQTTSPSMDISRAANVERFLYSFLKGDSRRVRELMVLLEDTGEFSLSAEEFARLRRCGLSSGSSDHPNRLEIIEEMFVNHHVFVDPHTADALYSGIILHPVGVKTLCLETVQPVKFPRMVRAATGHNPEWPFGYKEPPEVVTPPASHALSEEWLRGAVSEIGL